MKCGREWEIQNKFRTYLKNTVRISAPDEMCFHDPLHHCWVFLLSVSSKMENKFVDWLLYLQLPYLHSIYRSRQKTLTSCTQVQQKGICRTFWYLQQLRMRRIVYGKFCKYIVLKMKWCFFMVKFTKPILPDLLQHGKPAGFAIASYECCSSAEKLHWLWYICSDDYCFYCFDWTGGRIRAREMVNRFEKCCVAVESFTLAATIMKWKVNRWFFVDGLHSDFDGIYYLPVKQNESCTVLCLCLAKSMNRLMHNVRLYVHV